jgi:hypothetical protein
MLISIYFSLKEFHFCYNKQLTFANILTHMHLPPSQSVYATHNHIEISSAFDAYILCINMLFVPIVDL